MQAWINLAVIEYRKAFKLCAKCFGIKLQLLDQSVLVRNQLNPVGRNKKAAQ
jgi:hypothetical protein